MSTSFNDDESFLMIKRHYPASIAHAGAAPIMLPATDNSDLIARYAAMIDGLLLPGGDDLEPTRYGEAQRWQCGNVCPDRDAFELALCREVLRLGKPILGICRGIQLLNVALSGTLYQDLPSQQPDSLAHQQKQKPCYASHSVRLAKGSRMAAIYAAENVLVNSHHHQAIKDVGEGLRVTATAPDGVIEAVEHASHPFCVAVQWHPELLWEHAATKVHAKLFEAFVESCKSAK